MSCGAGSRYVRYTFDIWVTLRYYRNVLMCLYLLFLTLFTPNENCVSIDCTKLTLSVFSSYLEHFNIPTKFTRRLYDISPVWMDKIQLPKISQYSSTIDLFFPPPPLFGSMVICLNSVYLATWQMEVQHSSIPEPSDWKQLPAPSGKN